jgi:hypothetical protein
MHLSEGDQTVLPLAVVEDFPGEKQVLDIYNFHSNFEFIIHRLSSKRNSSFQCNEHGTRKYKAMLPKP